MQKRVVYNFNAQTVAQAAAVHANGKAVKASNAIGRIKRAFSGKSLKLALFVVLLFASLFCTIGSADWIISQQKNVPNVTDSSIFKFDDLGFGAHVNNGNPTGSYVFNGNSIKVSMSATASGGAQTLPDDAIKAESIKYKVKKCDFGTDPATLDEKFFDGIEDTTELPKDAGTYAVLITSTVKDASSGKTISYGKAIKVFTIAPCPVTIEWSGAVGFIYDGADHIDNITATAKTADRTVISGIVDISYSYATEPGATASTVTEVKNAGTYTATAVITNDNYVLAEGGKTEFKVLQKELTVKANPHQITYGDAPSTNGYEISGYANGETLESANISGTDTVKLTTNYTQFEKVGEYEIRVDISGLSSTNYSFKPVNGKLTVHKKELTVKANDLGITYGSAPATNGYTISGIIEGETPETANINGTVKLTTKYTQYGDVGDYEIFVDISGLSSPNYSFKAVNGILTVNKKELTVTAKPHQITYGDEPSANGYTISGFVNNDNESVINGLENLTYIIDYAQWQDIGQFSITPKVDGLSAVNYSFKANSDGTLIVKSLNIQLSGIIERDYDGSEFLFDKNLFTNATFSAPGNPTIDLSKRNIHQYISKASNANNFDNANGIAETPENGLFSYKFGEAIKAGSTYKIDSVTLNNKNLKLTKTEVYLKYKTAKIGDKYFTIEDAINSTATGDIILASNSSGTDTYVISAFTSLNYYGNKAFACSKNIIVPHTDGATTYENQKTGQTGNVGSVLIIPNGVSLTMNSSSLNILAIISQNNTTNTCTSAKRGVVMNQGTLTVKNQIKNGKNVVPNILAYGYLKGNGNVNVENGATVQDLFHLYDFKGGVITYGIHKKTEEYLPINSYSIHNVSCNVRVNTGCVYNTYYEITMGGEWFNGIIPVVSTADSSALFKLSSGYIEKRAIPAESATWKNKKDTTGINYGESLDKIKGSNQLAGQKEDIRICGVAVDGSIKITVSLKSILSVDMETGTNNPLPVPYMDIRVCNGGDLSLVNSSYKFMPGSSLTVDDGGKLTLGENAKLVLYSVEDCSVLEAPATYKNSGGTITAYPYSFITRYCVDKVNAYLLINSNNVTLNGGVSGEIVSEKSGIKLDVKKGSTDITVLNVVHDGANQLWPTDFYYADVSTRNASSVRPMKPCGSIMNSSSTAEETHFGTGTYYSTKIGSAYAWFKNSATITYVLKGGALNGTSGNTTQNITLSSGGYTNLPKPTRDFYTFDGWYFDSKLTQKATAIYTTCTLYAKWTPIQYKIQYILPYTECGTLANGSLSGNQEKELVSPPNKTITVDGTTYVFLGWYLNSDYSGNSVASVSAANADNSGIINIYAYYAGNSYTVTYEENPDNIKFANEKPVNKPESQNFSQGVEIPLASLRSLSTYDSDEDFDYYFAGWYLSTDSNEKIITSLPNTIDGDITLCAKWIKKYTVTINFTSNDTKLETENKLGKIVKYYKDGEIDLQTLYDSFSIATKIDEYYAPHGNIKEYTLIKWQENETAISNDIVNVTRDFDISAYHKRCYYITVQKSPNETVNGITGGLGTFYASPLDTTYATAVTCTLIANKERYTPKYSATNASVDTNGVISFANSNSAENVIINITTQRWFTVISNYGSTDFKIKQTQGENDGNWYTEGSKITISIDGRIYVWEELKKAAIYKDGKKVAELKQRSAIKTEYEITSLDGYYTINKLV